MISQAQTRVLTCIQCGKCTAVVPNQENTFQRPYAHEKKQFLSVIEESMPWYCTSCGGRTIRCPRDVKPSEVIIEMRAALVEEGSIPVAIQKALENTFVQEESVGPLRAKRAPGLRRWTLKFPCKRDRLEKTFVHMLYSGLRSTMHGYSGQRSNGPESSWYRVWSAWRRRSVLWK